MWSKFDMVQRVTNMSKYDWVWWMDFDTLITNTYTKLEDIIEESLIEANRTNTDLIDWIFTPDWHVFRFASSNPDPLLTRHTASS
jgi:mannan polymerase II complex MNN10 subunit